MPGENEYCRKRVVAMFNSYAGTKWVANSNTSFARPGVVGGMYESGRPDGFVFHQGKTICIECKAGFGSICLGDPSNDDSTQGWSAAQRSWWEHVAKDTGIPYFIACWIYPARERPERVMQVEAQLYLVPPECWLETETKANALGTKTIAAMPELERIHARKEVAASICFAPYALAFEGGLWSIPTIHPLSCLAWSRRAK